VVGGSARAVPETRGQGRDGRLLSHGEGEGMNTETKDALIWYIEKVNQMVAHQMPQIGEDLAREIIEAGFRLERALENDKTNP
jgi:hypothetical protein